MFKTTSVRGILTEIIEVHESTSEDEQYTEAVATLNTGQTIMVHIPETDVDIKNRNLIFGTGYYATGISDFFGLLKKTEIFFFTKWDYLEGTEEWHISFSAA